jgi:hypothetical protein
MTRKSYEAPAITATHDPVDMLFDLQRLGTMLMLHEKSLLAIGEAVPTTISNAISRLETYKR